MPPNVRMSRRTTRTRSLEARNPDGSIRWFAGVGAAMGKAYWVDPRRAPSRRTGARRPGQVGATVRRSNADKRKAHPHVCRRRHLSWGTPATANEKLTDDEERDRDARFQRWAR
jgi:hypothetical protein